MKTRLLKILIPVLIIIFAAFWGLSSKLPSTAFAIGDLTIDWGVPSGDPIFVINNFLPADMEEREVDVTNDATSPRTVGVKGIQTSEAQNFSDALLIEIFDGATSIYGPKTLTQFFTDSAGPTGIPLSTLAPSGSTTYKFKVTFDSSSGNSYQGAEIVFDLQIGITIDLPAECLEINFTGPTIFGTDGDDDINGTSSSELIMTFEGNDNIHGGGGDDCILSGEGADIVDGGSGNDLIDAGDGDDEVNASSGADIIYGGLGNDDIDGGTGIDTIYAEEGDDVVNASSGNDKVYGGAGNDKLNGGSDSDEVFGEEGNDSLEGGSSNDLLSGGDGIDSAKGGTGTDTCDAETEATCELNP